MVNYTYGKVYKIVSKMGNKIYIGITAKKYLSARMMQHKDDYKQWKEGKRRGNCCFELFEEYGFDNCEIILLEKVPCQSIDELHAKEHKYIEELYCVNRNLSIAQRTIPKSFRKVEHKKYLKVEDTSSVDSSDFHSVSTISIEF